MPALKASQEYKPSILSLGEALARGRHLTPNEKSQIYQYIKRMEVPQSSLMVGDRVMKRTGYKFPGEIRGVIGTRAGLIRVVVEADDADFAGMLHIYGPEQLIRRP